MNILSNNAFWHEFHNNNVYLSPRKTPTHKWPSWHNHTGSFPRYSYCSTKGLSIDRYKAALEENAEAWECFAITDHAFAIAIPDVKESWPWYWYDNHDIPEKYLASGETEARYRLYVDRIKTFRDGQNFFCGIEVESDAKGGYLVPDWAFKHFDVVIGSVHHEAGHIDDWVERHFFDLKLAMNLPCDIIGHPVRKMRKYSTQTCTLPHEILDETLDLLKSKNFPLEINAHFPQFADDVYLLRGAYRRDMEIAFSLDLHHPEEFGNWRYFEDVVEMSDIPFEKLKLFKPRRKPIVE